MLILVSPLKMIQSSYLQFFCMLSCHCIYTINVDSVYKPHSFYNLVDSRIKLHGFELFDLEGNFQALPSYHYLPIPPGDNTTLFYALKQNPRSEEHTSELQSRFDLVCRLLLA